MNILHLEASSGWGGQEIRILKESEGMRSRGHKVILAIAKKGKLASYARSLGFTVYEVDFRKAFWLFALAKIFFIIKKHDIQIVNTHSSLDSWIGGITARLAKVKIVRTRHLSTQIKSGWNSRILYGKLADFVVTTSSSILPMISKQAGKDMRLCRLIATGVDPTQIQYDQNQTLDWRHKLDLKESDFVVGTACFMRSWKGIDDLLEAAHRLRDFSDIKWVIIGGGHAEKHWKKAEELQLSAIVHFTGHLENPFPVMALLDVFALLSTAHEGVSQAILQAAFLKKPLIATTVGGLTEVCIDGETGFQVSPFSPDQVMSAVLKLKQSLSLREKYGNSAHLLVNERFTMDKTLDGMEDVYRIVCEKSFI